MDKYNEFKTTDKVNNLEFEMKLNL